MKTRTDTHPNVTYWACPEGDAEVLIDGSRFRFMQMLGLLVETDDLWVNLLDSELEEAEATVELHEAAHRP